MLALGVLTVVSALQWKNGVTGSTFNGLYVTDELSHLLKIASYIAVAVTLVYGRVYAQLRDMMRGGELYVLTLFALLGQMVMISSGNLISIYLGLELMSLALYALIALRRDNVVATEAAMKYFVLGALASGFLLYGMSMVYGATGHLTSPKSPRSSPPARPRSWPWCSASSSWFRAWRSSSAPCRSTCGCRTSTRVRRPRSR